MNPFSHPLTTLGTLRALTFCGVGTAGPDLYRATFDQETLEWRIWLGLNGRIDHVAYRTVTPPR